MGQGKKVMDHPAHDHHMDHFSEAMENALRNTDPSESPQGVSFQVLVSPNPGGVKEYIVTIHG
ncbi:MAG TPA: hypothetical protein VIR59_14565 [Gaiellaceae bacterium]